MSVSDEVFGRAASGELSLDATETLPLTSAETFLEEERSLLRRRCGLVFGLGLAISLALIVLARGLIDRPPPAAPALGRWEGFLDAAHIASFGLALASLYVGRPSMRRLQLTAFAAVGFNAILVVLSMGLVESDYPPALVVSLVLFVPAAVIPWRVGYQAALGAIAVTAPILARIASYAALPDVRARFAGEAAFRDELTVTAATLLILAATSVLVTHTLYSLRRKARKARRLGNYLIERELGRGGMGEIFVARHARMVRPSAVKVLRVSGHLDETALARFEREVQVSSSLTHPNTITIYDFGRADHGTFYYAMEYLEGLDLKRLVRQFGPVPAARATYILEQVCASLAEAHGRGIVHRDLKPANVFLTERGGLYDYVKVLDFGLARRVESAPSEQEVTRAGLVLGTPEYMAPEAVRGNAPVDTRADIYGLGAVAYFLLTGRPPFQADSVMQVLIDQVQTPPRPPSEVSEVPIPEALEELVLRCLAKRPEDRFQSIEAVGLALGAVPIGEPWTRDKAREWWRLHVGALSTA